MGGLRTCLVAVLALLTMTPGVRSDDDLAMTVAGCVGRFSAEIEFAWLQSDPRSDALSRERARFLSVLDAVQPAGAHDAVMAYRVDAKYAHAALLRRVGFDRDPRQVEAARQRSMW